MRLHLLTTVTAALLATGAPAQSLGDRPARITASGVTFTRSLNGAAEGTSVSADALTMKGPAKRDNFIDPDGSPPVETAPILLTRIDNTKPFTLTVRVTPTFRDTYDAGAVYLWSKADLWLKLAIEMDERHKARMVTVRTTGTSDDNNHEVVTAGSVRMKISSDTRRVGFYYSLDGKEWQLLRLFRNAYPAELWAGLGSQSPTGQGNRTRFDELSLTRSSIADFRLGQ